MKHWILASLLLFLSACFEGEAAQPEQDYTALLQKICQSQTLLPGAEEAQAPTAYAKACHMQRLTGINLPDVEEIYLCQSELYAKDFPEASQYFDADDVRAALGESAQKADILARHSFIGKSFAILMLKNSDTWHMIPTQAEIKSLTPELTTAQGALSWAYLQGVIGSGYAPRALCSATLQQSETGWIVKNIEVFQSCAPKEQRDLSISRKGLVTIERSEPQLGAPILCVD
jgi:hypothetical protein